MQTEESFNRENDAEVADEHTNLSTDNDFERSSKVSVHTQDEIYSSDQKHANVSEDIEIRSNQQVSVLT